MVEWVSLELAPTAHLEAGHLAWAELQYRGNLRDYFKQARELLLQYPMTPLAGHLMATQQFGSELQAELRAAHARAGPGGILEEHWEAIVTAYVKRLERTPGFAGWPDVRGGPRFKSSQFTPRNNHLDVEEVALEERNPLCEEERTARVHAIDSGPKKDAPPPRIGVGPRPCFCCGSDAHSWIQCPRKVSGKCGVCGSQEHPTFRCFKKYNPAPSARVNCVVSLPVDQVPEGMTVCEEPPSGEEAPAILPSRDSVALHHLAAVAPFTEEVLGDESATADKAVPETEFPVALLRTDTGEELGQLSRLVPAEPREVRPEERILPLIDPDKTGLLYYCVSYQGHPCATLLDCGASHSFLSEEWLRKKEIPTHDLKRPLSIRVFDGPAQQSITKSCRIAHVVLGTLDVAWTFMVVSRAQPHAILGLDFMRAYCLCYDPRTDALITQWANPPPGTAKSGKVPALTHLRIWPPTPEESSDPPPDTLLAHFAVPDAEWAAGALINEKGDRVIYDLAPSGDQVILCSVTADSQEEIESLAQVRAAMPSDLLKVVDNSPRLFAPPDSEPPEREVKHHIQLAPGACPIKRSPYPLSVQKIEALREQMKDLVTQGWIETSTSPWGAPVLFVPKKNGACDYASTSRI